MRARGSDTETAPEAQMPTAGTTTAPVAPRAPAAPPAVTSVADDAGNVLLWIALALVLGLAAGMLGASLGVSRKQRRLATSASVAVPMTPSSHTPE